MNQGQERRTKLRLRNASSSIFRRTAALFTLSSCFFCFFAFHVAVARAQDHSDELKPTEESAARFRVEQIAVAEVTWNVEEILPSLRYIAENGSEKDKETARALGSIFRRTEDAAAKELCLMGMKRIGNQTAQRELWRIYNDNTVAVQWRLACAEYLEIAPLQTSTPASTETSVGSRSTFRSSQ